MDSGEWRYGQADEAWTETSDSGAAESPTSGAAAPNLWGDDDSSASSETWTSTSSWLPAAQGRESGLYPGPAATPPNLPPATPPPATAPPTAAPPSSGGWPAAPAAGPWGQSSWDANAPVWGQPDTTPPPPVRQAPPQPGYGSPTDWRQASAPPNWSSTTPAVPAAATTSLPARPDLPYQPATGVPAPAASSLPSPSRTGTGLATSGSGSGTGIDVDGPYRRTGVDAWNRPEPAGRRRVADDDELRPRRRDPYGEEPAYGPVLAYTAGWYAIPGVFYVVWLITLDSGRQAFVGRQLVASLPWLFAAVVLSLAVAGMLRWAIVGWRALTLSFAAAVIGAGVTTIAHSLAL